MAKVFPIDSMQDWSFEQIEAVYLKLEDLARNKYKLDFYPNQIEVVSAEQMLDAYSSVGMPVMYKHWSFGKSFVQNYQQYIQGKMGLAYELVINSSPTINYLQEENSAMMQTLVIAHAAFGHNSFFKCNHLFKQWTDAEGIVDYLTFANEFIAKCEERHGWAEVEAVLDAAHAIQNYGVDKYKRARHSALKWQERQAEREEHERRMVNLLMDATIPKTSQVRTEEEAETFERQDNLLYFIEKNAPGMPTWKREIMRIVRKIAQYFYPQRLTKVMNEGWATFWHYTLMHDLREQGLLTQGCMLEFYESHCGVVWQHPRSNSMNPYALGFEIFQDIKRIAMEPDQEDRDWFSTQKWVGCGDWLTTLDWAMRNFKDESFIQQFMSPKVMRKFGLFTLLDDERDEQYEITAIHNDAGYRKVRDTLARQHTNEMFLPEICVVGYRKRTDRGLELQHDVVNARPLEMEETMTVLHHLETLWGYPVQLTSVTSDGTVRNKIVMKDGIPSVDVHNI